MTSDAELIRQRQAADDRNFMISSLDPERAPRLSPATHALRNLLIANRQGVTWEAALAEVLRSSDVAVKTADNILRKAVSAGVARKTGEYKRKRDGSGIDGRLLWLADWPTAETK